MPKISNERLLMYFTSNGSFYPLYGDAVKLYNALRTHADGEFPDAMISARRPNEPEEILLYRKTTYKAITKLPISKVITSFSKIRRSPDWQINFPNEKVSGKIAPEETLEQYCNYNIPGYGSITDWAFGILLKQNLIDANAVIAVIPLENIVQDSFAKPVPIVFNSDQVIQYNEREKYCILRSKRKINYMDITANVYKTGDIFYYIDENEIIAYEQGPEGFKPTFQQQNTTGKFPAFKVKAESFKQYDNMSLCRSRLDAMVPFLDEAACEYSDLKASKIQHLYPLFWYFQNKDCNNCNGLGKKPGVDGGQPTICSTCGGGGKVKFSPFAHIQVDPAGLGNQTNPIPPAGYIMRDTAILELQEKSVDKNNLKALAAINMQFLDQTPLNISGDAKNVDREELNNTVYNYAEDIVYSLDRVIDLINEWRYNYIVPDETKRKEMLPKIPVPQNFDLLPSDYLMQEITQARNNKANPFLLAKLEQEVAIKKFYTKPELSETIQLFFELDPLPGATVDEKMSLISNKAITQEDFVISSYMAQFIKRALIDDAEFAIKSYDDQMKVLNKYAAEKIKTNDAAQQMIDQQKQAVLAEMQQQQGGAPKPAV